MPTFVLQEGKEKKMALVHENVFRFVASQAFLGPASLSFVAAFSTASRGGGAGAEGKGGN